MTVRLLSSRKISIIEPRRREGHEGRRGRRRKK